MKTVIVFFLLSIFNANASFERCKSLGLSDLDKCSAACKAKGKSMSYQSGEFGCLAKKSKQATTEKTEVTSKKNESENKKTKQAAASSINDISAPQDVPAPAMAEDDGLQTDSIKDTSPEGLFTSCSSSQGQSCVEYFRAYDKALSSGDKNASFSFDRGRSILDQMMPSCEAKPSPVCREMKSFLNRSSNLFLRELYRNFTFYKEFKACSEDLKKEKEKVELEQQKKCYGLYVGVMQKRLGGRWKCEDQKEKCGGKGHYVKCNADFLCRIK